MSIWSSVGEDVEATLSTTHEADLAGRGADVWSLDVATATSWHDKIRLASWDETCTPGRDFLLDVENAIKYRDALTAAIDTIRRAYPDNPSKES